MNIFDPIVTGSLIVSGSEQITGNLSVSGTIYGNIAGTVAGGAGTGSNTFIGTQIISGNVFTSGTLGVNTPSNNGFQVYISTSINDGTLGLDAQPSAGNLNAMYFLKGGSKKFEISMDTSATPIFRLLPYTSSGFFEIGNPSNSGTDYSVVLESTYGNVLLGPGISNATGQISGATPSLHKVQINGSMFVSGSVTANSFTGSLLGTASYVTASNVFGTVTNASTASFVTSSNIFGAVTNAVTASFITGSGVVGNISGNAATSTTASYVTLAQTASYVAGANVFGNITGNSTNITAYTINQNLGTGNTVTYAGLTLNGPLNVNSATNNITGSLVISSNLTVLGSSSITYVTSSQLNVADNYIYVNSASPGVRFAGFGVIDSGSATTASLNWDSLNEKWVYSNPSGVGYEGGMLLSGPRNTGSLGQEVGLTAGRVPVSIGSDHLGDSIIFITGSVIAITGSLNITSNITAAGFTGSGASLTSIPNGALVNSAITIGSTSTSLGGTSTSLAGLTSVSSTAFTGSLQGTASTASFVTGSNVFGNISGNAGTATTLQTARNIYGNSFNGSADVTGTISNTYLANPSFYVGTTSITLGRASASQTLTGVSIDGTAGGETLATVTSRGSSTTAGITVNGVLYFNTTLYGSTKRALTTSDSYLRLDPNGDFTSGTYVLNSLRVDGAVTTYNSVTIGNSVSSGACLTLNRVSGQPTIKGATTNGGDGQIVIDGASNSANVYLNNYVSSAVYLCSGGGTVYSTTILPITTATYTLGSASYRWSTIYTNDLSLKNDYGDYTIVEGEENLYLYNNKSGKVFTFNLTEVDPATAPPKKYND